MTTGAIDIVLAYAVDRLSRNQNQTGVLFDEVEQYGAKLEFVTEEFEETAVGRFILAARAFAAEVEREKITERTMRGKGQRAKSGRLPQGTGKGCYGYIYDLESGKRRIEPCQAPIVQRIFEDFGRGESCNGIANHLNLESVPAFSGGKWHPLTVRRILLNETYTGVTIYRKTQVTTARNKRTGKKTRKVFVRDSKEWIEIPGASPRIVSDLLFNEAQRILNDPARRLRGKPTRHYRLRGYVKCLACDTPMVGQALQRGKYLYYRCRRSYAGFSDDRCDSRYVRAEKLEDVVLLELSGIICDPRRLLDEATRQNNSTFDSAAESKFLIEIRKIEEQQRRLVRLFTAGDMPLNLLAEESARLNMEMSRRQHNQREMVASTTSQIDLTKLEATMPQVLRALRDWVTKASGDELSLLLRALQVRIKASNEKVRIEGVVPLMDSDKSLDQGQDLVTIERTSA